LHPHIQNSELLTQPQKGSGTVRPGRDGDATTFHVHGSGMIIGRIVTEFGISRTMTGAIKDSFGPDDAWTSTRASRRPSSRP
jgi:hypothetical protein